MCMEENVEASVKEPTMGVAFPWLNMILDQTEAWAKLIPEDQLDWRPEDPSGKWCFSLGEIVMHCADARIMFARQLSGNDSSDGYCSEGPGEDGVWKFKHPGGKQAILDCLTTARKELEPFMQMPASAMGEVTEGTQAGYAKQLAKLKEDGKDTAEMEARGPANIVRVLMAAVVHEAGHRGTLLTLLRQKGINLAN